MQCPMLLRLGSLVTGLGPCDMPARHQVGVGNRLMPMPQRALAYEAQAVWEGETGHQHTRF